MTDPRSRSDSFTATTLPERYETALVPYLFRPWAEMLLDAVGVPDNAAVIDIASGTGIVARAAARRAGPRGRVLATDISPAMIAFTAAHPPIPGSAPIETAVASVTALGGQDAEYDVALCQQGMPFFPDRPAALAEIHRVLRPGGAVGIAVWTPGHEVVPFGIMNGVLRDLGAPEPFPNAYDESSYVLTAEQVAELLEGAGFHQVDSREVQLLTHWPDRDALHRGVLGTPFGAVLEGLDEATRTRAREQMAARADAFAVGSHLEVPTYSVIARGVA